MITGNTHPNCTLVPYGDAGEVESYIQDALKRGFSRPA